MSVEAAPLAGEVCTCGRPAVTVYVTERFGRIGFCGSHGQTPIEPCDCGAVLNLHSARWCASRTVREEA